MKSVLMAGVAVLMVAMSGAIASAGDQGAAAEGRNPVRTAKERLVNKAADEQRVNNCKVPVRLRGPKPRPDACRADASTASSR